MGFFKTVCNTWWRRLDCQYYEVGSKVRLKYQSNFRVQFSVSKDDEKGGDPRTEKILELDDF